MRSPTAERPVMARIRDRKEALAVESMGDSEEPATLEIL
jgi:hypothetical protein